MDKERVKNCKWLSEIYAEAAKTGREFQFFDGTSWCRPRLYPSINSRPENWRLEPVKPRVGVIKVPVINGMAPGYKEVPAIELIDGVKEALDKAGIDYE